MAGSTFATSGGRYISLEEAMTVRRFAFSLAGAAIAFGSVTAASAEPHSNMGLCSSYLGQMQVRDDVNRILNQDPELFGVGNAGELYRVRAQQRELGTAEEECLPRH